MRYLQSALLVALGGIVGVQTARAGDVKVIANSSLSASAISMDELKRVFLLTSNSISDGTHVEPVLEKGGGTHEAFLKDYLGKTDAALGTYYRSLVFTGKASMPKTFGSDAEVADYVAKTKGAIGYVSASAAVSGVKTLDVK
jgi:hypothetical protein